MEPRARAGRHKSGLNFGEELKTLFYGTGAPVHPDISHPLRDRSSTDYLQRLPTANKTNPPTPYHTSTSTSSNPAEPFPETLRVLDEIVTDYVIEICHQAATIANYAGRTKLKYSDFEWGFRRDRRKLGRVQELFRKKKTLDRDRKMAEMDGTGGQGGRLQVREMQDLGDVVGEEGTGKGKGRGRGRRKRKHEDIELADLDAILASVGVDLNGREVEGATGTSSGRVVAHEENLDDIDVDLDNDLEELGEADIQAAIGESGMGSAISEGAAASKRRKTKAADD